MVDARAITDRIAAVVATYTDRDADQNRKVRVLVHVLRFDDLLADEAAAFVVDDDALPFHIGRASDESAPQRVGRSKLVIPDRWASTGHCHIRRVGTSDVVHDDGSRNGTWVNGERVERYRVLADGDLIEVGHTLICYRTVDEHAAAALDATAGVAVGATSTRNAEVASVIRDLKLIAASREPVLIVGEPGVGKETAARAVHAWSGRAGPLRVIECGAVTDASRDAMFVGREPGDQGAIEHADEGTVLLDDVGELNEAAQATLLRAVEDGRVTLVGGTPSRTLDVRWVATTATDLFTDRGSLRADLLRSLAGYVARLPPLRRRREDLGTLSAWLLKSAGVTRASITPAAGRALYLGAFAGNIRQLRTVLRAAVTLAGDGPVDVRHLPPLDQAAPASAHVEAPSSPRTGRSPTEKEIVDALEATGGNVVRAAECLGAHPRQLYRWIERHEINLDRFRR